MKKRIASLLLVIAVILGSVCCVSATGAPGTQQWFKDQLLAADPANDDPAVEDVNVPVTIKVKLSSEPATSYRAALTTTVGESVDFIAELDMTRVKALVASGQTVMGPADNNRDVDGQFIINADWTGVLTVTNPLATGGMSGFNFYDASGNPITGLDLFVENSTRTITPSSVSTTISIKDTAKISDVLNLPNRITLSHSGFTVAGAGNVTGSFDVVNYATERASIETKTYTKLQFADGGRYVKYIFNVTPATISISTPGPGPGPSGGGGSRKLYTLTYNSNGGTTYEVVTYTEGTIAVLDKVPEKEGYIFDGWYADKELTKKIDSVKMTEPVTVYAAWKLDEGYEPVEPHPVPEMLNGEDHFAYINGYTDGTIRPNSNITRAEVATMFFRLLKDEVRDKYLSHENAFIDVNKDDWYNTAISTMAKAGVVNGRSADKFVPDEYITRAEFTAICARFDEANTLSENKFTDIDFHWAEEYILEATSYGWIEGYEDHSFRPDANITRAEAVTLINRVLNRVPSGLDALIDNMVHWTDNTNENAWYYVAMQEASNSHEYSREDGVHEAWTKLIKNRDWTVYEK